MGPTLVTIDMSSINRKKTKVTAPKMITSLKPVTYSWFFASSIVSSLSLLSELCSPSLMLLDTIFSVFCSCSSWDVMVNTVDYEFAIVEWCSRILVDIVELLPGLGVFGQEDIEMLLAAESFRNLNYMNSRQFC